MTTSLWWGIAFFLLIQTKAAGQHAVPGIKWQKTIGGSGHDTGGFIDLALAKAPKMSLRDRDGGYLIAGDVTSNNGDITGNHGGYECFVAKLDSARNMVWSLCLGGSANEMLGSLSLAQDSGYILTGSTNSFDGNLTGNHGFDDAWVARLDPKGNILWQKCYGGSNTDRGMHIALAGSGYIMLGTTTSHDGDVPFSQYYNYDDLWIVRLDSIGNILWQQFYGGYGLENPSVIKQTPDSGFIVAAHTNFQELNVTGPHGSEYDMWILKLDPAGNLEWEKFLGGTGKESAGDIEIHPLGGYLVTGITTSSDGDVTGFHGPAAKPDAWVVRLSSTGNILWQKCYGGSDIDILSDIQLLSDHSFVAAGLTYSVDGDVSTLRGYGDAWLVACNPDGNLVWEKTFGGSNFDGANSLTITPQGTYLMAGSTASNDQDVSGLHGQSDIWLFETGAINTITGTIFYDANKDGVRNNGETYFDKVTVRAEKGGLQRSAIPLNGIYRIDVDTGTYAVQAVPHSNYYQVVPANQTITFNNFFNIDSLHFGVQPIPGIPDLTLSFYSMGQVQQGGPAVYVAWFKNVGTEVAVSGQIKVKLDPRFSIHHTTPPYIAINNDTLIWNYSQLLPNTGSFVQLQLMAGTLPALNIGDTLRSFAQVVPDGGDNTPEENKVVFREIVYPGYSPIQKTESNAGIITPDQVSQGQYLNYRIRFENIGTDTAYNTVIRDTLDPKLNWNTFQMVDASHPYQLTIEDGNKIAWHFNDIRLPSNRVNFPNSRGYIAYRIKPVSTVQVGDTIKNTAAIYFDFSLPISTNTERTVVFNGSVALPVTWVSFQATLAGTVVNVSWKTNLEQNASHFEVQRSPNGIDFTTIGIVQAGRTAYLFTDKEPLKGYNYYRLRSIDIDGSYTYSTIVLVNVQHEGDIISSIYPNPGNGNIILKLQGSIQGNVLVQVFDQQGRILVIKPFGDQHTTIFSMPMDLGHLPKGNYILNILVDGKKYQHNLLVQ